MGGSWRSALVRVLPIAAGFALGSLGACLSPTLVCLDDSGCLEQGEGARCEANQRCSLPDDDCSSGRRYHSGAGQLADRCVDPETAASGTAGTSATGGSTGAAGGDSTSAAPATTSGGAPVTTGAGGDLSTDTGAATTGNSAIEPGVLYAYYEGEFDVLPNFSELTPVEEGVSPTFDIGVAVAEDAFALRFEGLIEIAEAGTYTFYAESDDGSKIELDGAVIVDNDGVHSAEEVSGEVDLEPGQHPIVVEFFEGGGGETLAISYEGPGISKTEIPAEVLFHEP